MYKIILIIFTSFFMKNTFLDEQKKFPRVSDAITEKLEIVQKVFQTKKIEFPPKAIFIRAFKSERVLELWAQSVKSDTFQFVKKYMFCSSSGILGPKRMQGDFQIPEGFYYIDRFNPVSNFHLSLGINYPNNLDRELGKKDDLGGDIFIHGDCVTIGCIPITDHLIKELYIIAIFSKDNNQKKIPVHIFPAKLTGKNLAKLIKDDNKHFKFWSNLKEGYDYFQSRHKIPSVKIDKEKYIFQ